MKKPQQIEMSEAEAGELLQRLEAGELDAKDYELLAAVLKGWLWLSGVVRHHRISIKELKKLIFGARTEKTQTVLKPKGSEKADGKNDAPKKKRKGHGRKGADAYTGAERTCLRCTEVRPGERCPKCGRGKVYPALPSQIVCIRGQAPVQARIYERERLRCNLCGAWFKAAVPQEATGPKYDPSAASMMGLLHYGCGFPFNRLDALQDNLGIPLPSSTQWDVLNATAREIHPAFGALNRQAARGEVFHNDDTQGRVLALEKQIAEELEACQLRGEKCRTGVFTTGIVVQYEGRRIALFFTGRRHAGENLSDLLEQRPDELPMPIQMCDALCRNASPEFKRLLANCLCHGRREFVKIVDDFPEKCRHVLETLREVYKNDAFTKKRGMSKEDRLAFHQQNSKPIMDEFLKWLNAQLDEKKVEPNSRMGGAINYMIKHWEALTLFLRVAGAPLDNNICECALKIPIRYRNNSLFFRSERGAFVGDVFMSLIHTCRFNGVNAFEYLRALVEHAPQVAAAPEQWLPWNYHDARPRCASP